MRQSYLRVILFLSYFVILRIKRNLFKETVPPEQEQEKTEDTP